MHKVSDQSPASPTKGSRVASDKKGGGPKELLPVRDNHSEQTGRTAWLICKPSSHSIKNGQIYWMNNFRAWQVKPAHRPPPHLKNCYFHINILLRTGEQLIGLTVYSFSMWRSHQQNQTALCTQLLLTAAIIYASMLSFKCSKQVTQH